MRENPPSPGRMMRLGTHAPNPEAILVSCVWVGWWCDDSLGRGRAGGVVFFALSPLMSPNQSR